MTLKALDAATQISAAETNRYTCQVGKTWWNFESAFGGWAAALAAEAVKASPDYRGELISLNSIIPSAIKVGAIDVKVERLVKRAQTDFWRVSMFQSDPDEALVFSADIVASRRRGSSDAAFQVPMPVSPEPSSVPLMDVAGMGPAWMQYYEQRMFVGQPFTINERPLTRTWIREADGRYLDAKALLAIADTPMPRAFFAFETPRFGSTVSLSINIFASDDLLKNLDSNLVMIEADSRAVGDGMFDQCVSIWSESGILLAVSNQLAFFK
ncbi:MAG: thioesterase family protein [Henriciella sp.]|nr:thioesterase family protein [Henriciella sp.]